MKIYKYTIHRCLSFLDAKKWKQWGVILFILDFPDAFYFRNILLLKKIGCSFKFNNWSIYKDKIRLEKNFQLKK